MQAGDGQVTLPNPVNRAFFIVVSIVTIFWGLLAMSSREITTKFGHLEGTPAWVSGLVLTLLGTLLILYLVFGDWFS
jgi:hypothetical protein